MNICVIIQRHGIKISILSPFVFHSFRLLLTNASRLAFESCSELAFLCWMKTTWSSGFSNASSHEVGMFFCLGEDFDSSDDVADSSAASFSLLPFSFLLFLPDTAAGAAAGESELEAAEVEAAEGNGVEDEERETCSVVLYRIRTSKGRFLCR